MEVNSQMDRLDLRDESCLAAKRAGVKLVVSSDAHSPTGFGLLSKRSESGAPRIDRSRRRSQYSNARQITPAPLDSRVIAR
jgi:hypothetical protein